MRDYSKPTVSQPVPTLGLNHAGSSISGISFREEVKKMHKMLGTLLLMLSAGAMSAGLDPIVKNRVYDGAITVAESSRNTAVYEGGSWEWMVTISNVDGGGRAVLDVGDKLFSLQLVSDELLADLTYTPPSFEVVKGRGAWNLGYLYACEITAYVLECRVNLGGYMLWHTQQLEVAVVRATNITLPTGLDNLVHQAGPCTLDPDGLFPDMNLRNNTCEVAPVMIEKPVSQDLAILEWVNRLDHGYADINMSLERFLKNMGTDPVTVPAGTVLARFTVPYETYGDSVAQIAGFTGNIYLGEWGSGYPYIRGNYLDETQGLSGTGTLDCNQSVETSFIELECSIIGGDLIIAPGGWIAFTQDMTNRDFTAKERWIDTVAAVPLGRDCMIDPDGVLLDDNTANNDCQSHRIYTRHNNNVSLGILSQTASPKKVAPGETWTWTISLGFEGWTGAAGTSGMDLYPEETYFVTYNQNIYDWDVQYEGSGIFDCAYFDVPVTYPAYRGYDQGIACGFGDVTSSDQFGPGRDTSTAITFYARADDEGVYDNAGWIRRFSHDVVELRDCYMPAMESDSTMLYDGVNELKDQPDNICPPARVTVTSEAINVCFGP